jgi:hypothetical protein
MKIITPLLMATLLAGAQLPAATVITFTYENPGVQTTSVVGAVTETFTGLSGALNGYSSTNGGTYTGGQVIPANQYGGAGGVGDYVVSGLETNAALQVMNVTFSAPKTYFGLWWSAGDGANTLEFYQGATLLNTFTVGASLDTLNGGLGLPAAYYGNPTGNFLGQNSLEPYVYLNFTSSDAAGFDRIKFINLTTSGFETDNHSTYDKVITPPGNQLPVPEGGSSVAILGLGLLGLAGLRRQLR